MSDAVAPSDRRHPSSLRRSLGVAEGTALTIGAVLGTGVLVLPAITAARAGPAALVAWAVMGVMSLAFALVFGALAARFPDAGGIASYARLAFGGRAGFTAGLLLLGTVPLGPPIAALIGASYATTLFGWPAWIRPEMAAGLLLVSLALNYRGIEISARTQMAAMLLVAVILLASVVAALPHVHQAAFHPFAPWGWSPVGVDVILLFWAFVGWEMMVNLAEEFHDPLRDIPKVMVLSLIVIDLVYLSVATVTVGSRAYTGSGHEVALAVMMGMGFGQGAEAVTGILAVLVTFATSHAYNAGFSRLIYAQARSRELPSFLSHLHPRFASPDRATLAMGLSFLLVFLLSVLFHISLGGLILYPSSLMVFLYIVAMASGLRLLKGTGVAPLTLLGLVPTVLTLPFMGWAILFPLALLASGLILFRGGPSRRRRADPFPEGPTGGSQHVK